MPLYHYTRVNDKFKKTIYGIIKNNQFNYSNHAARQKQLKNVKDWEYIAEHGTLIEFNQIPNGHKALLRTPDGHCAVFGLSTFKIITMWWNDPNDTHRTLDASKYYGGVVDSKL